MDGNPSYPQTHTFDRVDAMLISHGHFDHIHDAVPLAKKFEPTVIAIYETGMAGRQGRECQRHEQGRHSRKQAL